MTNRITHAGAVAPALTTALACLLPLALYSAPVLAHPGAHHATLENVPAALVAGFLHPLTGLDHLLAIAATGVWSARQPQGARLLPLYLVAMLLGALGGAAGLALAGLETGIAATVVASGMLVMAATVRLPTPAAMALLTGFAMLHGNAHGLELPLVASAGFIAASGLLLLAGRRLGAWASAGLVRTAGAGVAAAGVAMLAGL
ncbi:MAG: HupE/UreJ family protein [Burkholderiaceae bacterium]|nr:HupE/UreJ family protein [Burkholderiaceae bacterium]